MLGHLKPQLCRLPSSARRQYRQLYCSLCYSLRRQFGLPASLLVSHEMTLSLAACSGEWETVDADCGCPARLFCRSRPVVLHDGIDRAARYSLLLAWLKLHDWESDSGSRWARALRRRLDPAVAPILAELSAETRAFIDTYLGLVRDPAGGFAPLRESSGLLAQYLFQELVQQATTAGPTLRRIIRLTGELLPVADALLDVRRDRDSGQANPVLEAMKAGGLSLAAAFGALRQDYETLAADILSLSQTPGLPQDFTAILQQSLRRLDIQIRREEDALLGRAAPDNGQRRRKPKEDKRDWCDCCDCGDCCDCIQCLPNRVCSPCRHSGDSHHGDGCGHCCACDSTCCHGGSCDSGCCDGCGCD